MISVIGSSGIDHVLIPYKNDWNKRDRLAENQRLFTNWPELSYVASFNLPAGAVFLQRLIEEIGSKRCSGLALPLVSGSKRKTKSYFERQELPYAPYWETFSFWDLFVMEGKNGKTDVERTYANPRHYYGRSGPSDARRSKDEGSLSWEFFSGITPEEVEGSTVLSVYDEVSFNEDIDGNNPSEALVISNPRIPVSISRLNPECKAVIRTRIHYHLKRKAHFNDPAIVQELINKGLKKENMVLLVNEDELKRGGALLGTSSCWENVFYYLRKTIEVFDSAKEYLAVVIGLSTHGALLYQYKEGNTPDNYTLFYYEDEIGDLSSSSVKGLQGKSFGSMTILQAALSLALHDNEGDAQSVLKQGVTAGLYAIKQFSEKGYVLTNRHTEGYPLIVPDKLGFPFEDVADAINKVVEKEVSITDPKVPSCIDINHDWFSPFGPEDNNEVSYVDSILKTILTDESEELKKNWGEHVPFHANDEQDYPFVEGHLPAESHLPAEDCQPTKGRPPIIVSPPTESSLSTEVSPTTEARLSTESRPPIIDSFELLPGNNRIFIICSQIIKFGGLSSPLIKDGCKTSPPYLRLGGFLTYDKNEMLQVCNTYNTMKHYMRNHYRRSPLSICIFGQPGSGKSFVVKEITNSLDDNRKGSQLPCELLTFNVSQMQSTKDLVEAFHQVRDSGLNEKMPVVFFDEFDSEFKGTPLGWLRFFLAPMQDGEFFHEGVRHKIGSPILIFAGGTCSTMSEFKNKKLENDQMEDVKLPDFISRLRGYIEVAGPNSTKTKGSSGILHYIRRACLIRTLLEKQYGVNQHGYIGVNDEVIYALLNAKKYTNGTRSLQSVIQMGETENARNVSAAQVYSDGNGILLHLEGGDPIENFEKLLRNVLWEDG